MLSALRLLVLASVVTVAVTLSASPAVAGGIVVVASPSENNSCLIYGGGTVGGTGGSPGTSAGNVVHVPARAPLSHCGGADLPLHILNTIGHKAWFDQNVDKINRNAVEKDQATLSKVTGYFKDFNLIK